MWLAVIGEDGEFAPCFERAKSVMFYETEGERVLRVEIVEPDAKDAGDLADTLLDFETDVLFCGKITPESVAVLKERGIGIISGRKGPVEDTIHNYLVGKIVVQ